MAWVIPCEGDFWSRVPLRSLSAPRRSCIDASDAIHESYDSISRCNWLDFLEPLMQDILIGFCCTVKRKRYGLAVLFGALASLLNTYYATICCWLMAHSFISCGYSTCAHSMEEGRNKEAQTCLLVPISCPYCWSNVIMCGVIIFKRKVHQTQCWTSYTIDLTRQEIKR